MSNNTIKGVGTRCSTKGCRKYKNINENGLCPKHVSLKEKLAASNDVAIYKCGTCKNPCEDNDRGILCPCCDTWFHSSCVDIDDDAYDVLMKIPRLKWNCDACDDKVEELLEKSGSLGAKTTALRVDLTKVEERLDAVESKLAGKVHKEIHTAINERADIERRKLNLVVYNLPEPPLPMNPAEISAWDSKKDIEHNIKSVSDIIKAELRIPMSQTDNSPRIINAIRLGKNQLVKMEHRHDLGL